MARPSSKRTMSWAATATASSWESSGPPAVGKRSSQRAPSSRTSATESSRRSGSFRKTHTPKTSSSRSPKGAGMETWDAFRARRNVRRFADRPIAPEDLDRILEAGRRSPSSMNEQRWDFIVVTDREQLQELSKVWRGGRDVGTPDATVGVLAPEAEDDQHPRHLEVELGLGQRRKMVAAAG